MSSSGVNRGGGSPRPKPLPGQKDADESPPGDDDSIEILEVVGMEDDAGVSADDPAAGDGRDASDDVIEITEETAGPAINDAEQAKLREMLLRSRADFDNFRKRTAKEMQRLRGNATADVLGGLLPILDNLERALDTSASDDDALRQGVEMIQKQLVDALKQVGLAVVATDGVKFDPNIHDAMEMVDCEDSEQGTIVEVMQKGYMVNDRLLRPALVKVASGNRPDGGGPGADATG